MCCAACAGGTVDRGEEVTRVLGVRAVGEHVQATEFSGI